MNVRLVLIILSLTLGGINLSIPVDAFVPSGFLSLKESQSPLGWGGVYHRVDGVTPSGWVTVQYITLDLTRYRAAIAHSSAGIGTVSSVAAMVRETNAVAGINANFFDPPTGLPVGFLLKDGQVLNTPYLNRATLAISFFGELHFVNPHISLTLRTPHGTITVDGINRPLSRDALIVYTPEYAGPRGLWNNARVVAIQGDQVKWIGSERSVRFTERGMYWLAATGSAKNRLANLLPAERVKIDYAMSPELYLLRDAFQAGPMLLREGQIALVYEGFQADMLQKPAARSALARTRDGTLILLIVTRGNGSVGMNLYELAQFLRTLGAVDAMALDGGGSSSLVFQDGTRLRTLGSSREIPVSLVFLRR